MVWARVENEIESEGFLKDWFGDRFNVMVDARMRESLEYFLIPPDQLNVALSIAQHFQGTNGGGATSANSARAFAEASKDPAVLA